MAHALHMYNVLRINSSPFTKGLPSVCKTVPAKNVGQKLPIDRFFLQELRYSQKIFRSPNTQRDRHDMLRPQDTRFHGPLCLADQDLYLFGSSERLNIQVSGHRQKLNRPAFDKHTLF